MSIQSAAISVAQTTGTPTAPGLYSPSVGSGGLATYVQGELAREANRRLPPSVMTTAVAGAVRTTEERLYDNLAALKIATAQVAMHLSREQRTRLFRGIDRLLDPTEWPIEQQALVQLGSFGVYLRMLIDRHPLREPALGLSVDGYLLAGWIVGRDRLSLEFREADEVRWAVTCYINEDLESAGGFCSLSRLSTVLDAYNPQRWFGDGKEDRDQSP